MRDRLRILLPLLLGVILVVALAAGCDNQGGTTGEDTQADTNEPQSLQLDVVEQWAQSGHARPITFAAEEEGCKNCHDGLTFTETGGGFQPRMGSAEGTGTGGTDTTGTAQQSEETTRDWVVATDCRSCHTAAGVQIAEEGEIDGVPSLETAEGGMGALCMACHNGWHPSGASDGELSAPHYSVQTDIIFGVNTMPVESAGGATQSEVASESPHLKVDNTCVGCHVSAGDEPNHRFAIENFDGCQREGCHESDMTDGGKAKEDFDGDGTTENFQQEVQGLLDSLEAAINKSAGTDSFDSRQGQVAFEGGSVTENDPAYAAAYNFLFVEKEGSLGVHNPEFTVKLLQDSISSVGGTVGGSGGGSETTGTGEGTGTP